MRSAGLPGEAGSVRAESVLVVAPHPDDELLGCGGLVLQLAASGAAVRVLFLTDGGGGEEHVADREAYRRRRRAEAEEVARRLGVAGTEWLGLPDGALEEDLERAAAGIERCLLAQRPDLVLAPSPVEASPDHRAAFAALHRLLGGVRDGSPLAAAVGGLRVLVYEVNRPLPAPDLLVDVGAQLPAIEEAMAAYASQEERHPYLQACLGLRRFRTLSLGPEVRAAEAYRELSAADFATRGPAALIRELGGSPELLEVREGPRISVVVRTKDRPGLLAEALASLAAATYRRVEVVLVNDGGERPSIPDGFPHPVIAVDLSENRGRAAAANAGVEAATGDCLTFLDDDDLAEPEHLATLASLVSAAGVRAAYTDAAVGVYELADGGWRLAERRLPYSRDFDAELLLLDNYIPFNTLVAERRLFAEVGPFDEDLPFFEDWDFLIRLARRTPLHHLQRVTCEYRLFRGSAHHALGHSGRERRDFLAVRSQVVAKHAHRHTPELLARVADRLRAEAVAQAEAARTARREAAEREERERERSSALERGHRELELEAERLRGQDRALHESLAHLHRVVDDQSSHLARTYAEIERLNGVIRAMEATRAWRLHQWWQRGRRR